MTTIKDIAKEAGVSYTTVSNVIHGKSSRVSAQTIAQINEIIKLSGYAPNMSARSLVSNSSKVIGIINHLVPKASGGFIADPFHSAFIGAVEETLRENGYYLMLRTVEDSMDLLSFLRNWNIDGMFFTGLFEDEFFDMLSTVDVPIVLIDSYINHPNMQNVGLEDFKGGYLATKYLIENGHRNIAFASPPIRSHGVVEERLRGYRQALDEYHIPFQNEFLFQGEFDMQSDMLLSSQIAANRKITAVFATADILAAGIIAGLHASGLDVPNDISVIGFDDIPLCRLISPTLTTIHQDAAEKGKAAVEFMMNRLKNNPIERNQKVLPVHLIERKSVKRI